MTHHHLWDRGGWTYLLPELLADLNTGHKIIATVFEECRSMYRGSGPVEMRPVGEVEFVAGIAAMSASGGYEFHQPQEQRNHSRLFDEAGRFVGGYTEQLPFGYLLVSIPGKVSPL